MNPEVKVKSVNVEVMQNSVAVAANKGIMNQAVCQTAANTAAKTVTMGNTFDLVTKAMILVKFQNAITVANATLNITHTDLGGNESSTGAKAIHYRGAALPAGLVKAGTEVPMRYDGTRWNIIGDLTPSGFTITSDEEHGIDEFSAIGSASITEDDEHGYDEFDF